MLIHWHDMEARALAEPLESAGFTVEVESEDGIAVTKRVTADPPLAVVICLDRLPSHGHATAAAIHSSAAGCDVPIFSVGGDPDQVRKLKSEVATVTPVELGQLIDSLRRLEAV